MLSLRNSVHFGVFGLNNGHSSVYKVDRTTTVANTSTHDHYSSVNITENLHTIVIVAGHGCVE